MRIIAGDKNYEEVADEFAAELRELVGTGEIDMGELINARKCVQSILDALDESIKTLRRGVN